MKEFRKSESGLFVCEECGKEYKTPLGFTNIERGPSIKYNYLNKDRIYLSDFFIPSLNLIIEIKSSYLFNRDKKMIEEKKKAVKKIGYKYIIVIDKNYENLNGSISKV